MTAVPIIAPEVPLIPLGNPPRRPARAERSFLDHCSGQSLDRPVQPGAEEGIDYRLPPRQTRQVGSRSRPVRLSRAIAASPRRRAIPRPASTSTLIPPLSDEPGRHESIATVISWSRYDDDATSSTTPRQDRSRDRTAGPLHELDAGHAVGDRLRSACAISAGR